MNANSRRDGPNRKMKSLSSIGVSGTRTATAIWTPDDFAAHLPDAPLLSSKGTVAWEGIVVEKRSQAPQELAAPAMSHHLLGLVIGPHPFYFWRDIGGEV